MNKIRLSGTVLDKPVLTHEINGKKFYDFRFGAERTSGFVDKFPCVVSESLVGEIHEGLKISANGIVRSRNATDESGKSRLLISVLIDAVGEYGGLDQNDVEVEGYICKPIICRETPKGRKIADLLIAVNRSCYRNAYLPSVVWSENAEKAKGFEVGCYVSAVGRLQSREYTKIIDGVAETRVAYELSLSRIDAKESEE